MRSNERIGHALWLAQNGKKADSAKPLKGFRGGNVLEVVSDYDKDTFRGVYTIEFEEAVYLVDAFEKKAKKGSETPKMNMDRIIGRLKDLRERRKSTQGKADIAALLGQRASRQAVLDVEKERKNDI